uniref:Fe2OG dioxygenase domain-containing protein n=1 Tax=Salix viminalis TaxID=40686 RepID=A0A6N2LR36_SALVM
MAAETASPFPPIHFLLNHLVSPPSLPLTPSLLISILSRTQSCIDYSLLISGTPGQRSEIVHELGRACEDWGFFMVINHGVPQKLLSSILDGCRGFFDLEEEEKQEFKGSHVLDPISQPTKITSIKTLAESPGLTSIPATHTFTPDLHGQVINHGVPQKLLSLILDGCRGFFDLEEEEKQEFKGNHVLDPIRSGTSFNVSVEKAFYWRDFLKVFVHPVFYSPTKPAGLSEISLEYSQRVREIARGLLTGISESLGLEGSYIDKALNLERGKQIFIANLYPTCPQPELAMGMPSHSDHGLLTLLIQNGIGGLQIQHKGKWVNVGTHSNSFLVNTGDHLEVTSVPEASIPVIDYSLLISGTPGQRSKIVHELGRACQDWGFFMVINHGVPQKLLSSILDGCRGFFDLEEEEKQEFKGNHKAFYWRDFLKVFVHPVFYSPTKPAGLSEISLEYSQRVREIARGLLTGISESLGLEGSYIDKALNLERGKQIFIANLYPTCPQPELAMGMPPHSDHGLLTLLIQNGIGGLQIQHKGKWVNVGTHPNSFLVNTGDHLEILSNGRYKSVLHRAMVNSNGTRMSIAMAHGPSLDSVVSPAPELLVSSEGDEPAAYIGMKYKDYLELQQSNKLDGKSCLNRVRISAV